DDLRQRVAERLADLRMVMRLEEIRSTDLDNPARYSPAAADKTYTQLFREFGIDVERSDAAEAGRQLGQRVVRVQLALALDGWARVHMGQPQQDSARWKRLLAMARAADPDEWRGRVRDALERLDAKGLVELARAPEAGEQPAATVELMASALEVM